MKQASTLQALAGTPKPALKTWVLVAGGVHGVTGMDGANAALAAGLLDSGHEVHIVAHKVDPELSEHPNAYTHIVSTPAGSYLIGEVLLGKAGYKVSSRVTRATGARVIVNGANCRWGDINWVHSVHQAWECKDAAAPALFRLKNRATKFYARHREGKSLPSARLVIANSQATRENLMRCYGLPAERIRVVYLGSDPSFGTVRDEERKQNRLELGIPAERPAAVFVGALSHDCNKGLDTLLAAWLRLIQDPDWDVDLVVAGGGSGVPGWKKWCEERGVASRIRILGHTSNVAGLLSAADVLVSPVRYEAYGLNVQEAICRGVPAIVSASAGVAERYPSDLQAMLLRDPNQVDALADRLKLWRANLPEWKHRFAPLGAELRAWTWRKMADEIIRVAA